MIQFVFSTTFADVSKINFSNAHKLPTEELSVHRNYLHDIAKKIKYSWIPPEKYDSALSTRVLLKIAYDGKLILKRVIKLSGSQPFDKSFLDAIKSASPVSPPPGYISDVEIGFPD